MINNLYTIVKQGMYRHEIGVFDDLDLANSVAEELAKIDHDTYHLLRNDAQCLR